MNTPEHSYPFSKALDRSPNATDLLETIERLRTSANETFREFAEMTKQVPSQDMFLNMRFQQFIRFFAENFMSEDETLRFEVAFCKEVDSMAGELLEKAKQAKADAEETNKPKLATPPKSALFVPGR